MLRPAQGIAAYSSMDRINNTVYEHRQRAALTQEQLAEKAGVTRQTVIAIEKGNYAPSVALALRLAAIFKTSVEKLFHIA